MLPEENSASIRKDDFSFLFAIGSYLFLVQKYIHHVNTVNLSDKAAASCFCGQLATCPQSISEFSDAPTRFSSSIYAFKPDGVCRRFIHSPLPRRFGLLGQLHGCSHGLCYCQHRHTPTRAYLTRARNKSLNSLHACS